jgi:histidyl-tRNA synthetase
LGWGDVTLANFLQTHQLMPELKPETDIYVALVGNVLDKAQTAIGQLRKKGFNVAVDISERKLGDQLKAADKKGVQQVLIIGENELKTNKFNLKNLDSGQETIADLPTIIKRLQKN